jgi:PUA domain protein
MSAKIKNRHKLKSKEIKQIIQTLKNRYSSDFFDIRSSVEMGNLEEFEIILVDNNICFMIIEDNIVFTLRGLYKYQPKEFFVIVDMGAVGFVTKGADIMAPGIIDADECIQENDYVWICDEKHKKPLAVGIALINGEEMKCKKTGKAIKNLHFVGDRLWNLSAI